MSKVLFSPVSLGPVELRNRVVATSHQTSLVQDHLPTDDLVAYHAARAAGGVGAIFLEATAVHRTGLLTPHTLGGYLPGMRAGYERLAGAVHPHGARLFVQLFHGGREQFGTSPMAPAVAPSAIPSPRFHSEPRSLTRGEIREVIGGFARSATAARDGGLDGVEVSMAHGYLAAQFFNGRANVRDDEYGGASRMRFGLEVLEAIRAQVGLDIAVGVRLAANELDPDGDEAARCAEIVEQIARTGLVDFISLALGHSASYPASTWIAPPPPTAAEDAIVEHLPSAGAVAGVPLIATTRIVDLEHAERIVASGVAQVVGMTRALIAEPALVRKALEGRAGEGRDCIGCNQACIGHYHQGVPIGCVVNPHTGREARLESVQRTARRLLVIGAGPAGVSAAVEGARAGDQVMLVEREPVIGGQFRLAGHAPGHADVWARYQALALRQLDATGVELRLGAEVTASDAGGRGLAVGGAMLDAADYDAVILATGARPYAPRLAADDVCLVDAWTAIEHPETLVGPVLVADWGGGWAGLDAAEVMAGADRPVTLACGGVMIGESLHQYQRNGYLDRLDRAGVTILHHYELAGAWRQEPSRPDGMSGIRLRHAFSARERPLPAEIRTVVVAYGRAPQDSLWAVLETWGNATRVGDAFGPRSLEEAILEGFFAGRATSDASPMLGAGLSPALAST
jgi:2,4-dienoyl-CoA reductase-like NADH-dependent reductase (Old Yellow Enzyme family)